MDLLRSLPIGLYLEHPITWLHRLDPRVKLAWLMSILVAPILASPVWKIVLVLLLILLTLAAGIPLRVWRQQMGWLLLLAFFILIIGAISPDGLGVKVQPRLPPDELAFSQQPTTPVKNNTSQDLPWYNLFSSGHPAKSSSSVSKSLPQPTAYRYILWQQGPITVSRTSLDLAISLSTLIFTLFYASNLYLLTTSPEEITAGIESLMQPLKRLNLPITEISLTLTLSLRFIPLVMEEVQNLSRSIQTRAINWKKLGLKGGVQVWLLVAERIMENLLLRAEQMADAMLVRGFTSPNTHRVTWYQLRINSRDWIAIAGIVIFWAARLSWGNNS